MFAAFLKTLFFHGATEQILIDAHPHIGTNKLPKIIQNIRENILKYGGEIHFESRVTDLVIKENKLRAIQLQNGTEMSVNAVILATGHSAGITTTFTTREQTFNFWVFQIFISWNINRG